MRTVIAAGFVVYRRATSGESLFLILRYTHGHWDLPKGKAEAGESLRETATRELYEETGLRPGSASDFTYTFGYDFTEVTGERLHKEVTFFLTQITDESVVISDEHISYGWYPYQDALIQLTYQNACSAIIAAHKAID